MVPAFLPTSAVGLSLGAGGIPYFQNPSHVHETNVKKRPGSFEFVQYQGLGHLLHSSPRTGAKFGGATTAARRVVGMQQQQQPLGRAIGIGAATASAGASHILLRTTEGVIEHWTIRNNMCAWVGFARIRCCLKLPQAQKCRNSILLFSFVTIL